MNDLLVTGYPCYAQKTLGSPGSKHCESRERNVLAKSCLNFPLIYRKWTWAS